MSEDVVGITQQEEIPRYHNIVVYNMKSGERVVLPRLSDVSVHVDRFTMVCEQ